MGGGGPYNWDETDPTPTSLVSAFPANEQAARGQAKAAFGDEHDPTTGRHMLPRGTFATRNAYVTPKDGTLFVNDVDGILSVYDAGSTSWVELGCFGVGDYKEAAYNPTSPPEGWLPCDGAAVSRATYARLFAKIGTAFGAGDGSTTFNVPNRKGRVGVGYDAGDADYNAIGKTGGEKLHTLTVPEMPAHAHVVTDPGHAHTVPEASTSAGGGTAAHGDFGNVNLNPSTSSDTTGITVQSAGGGGSHENRPPFVVSGYLIKT